MASSGSSVLKTIIVLAVVGAAAGGYYYYRHNQAEAKAPEYTTTTVTRGDITQVITATGQLDAVLSVDVGSQISGLVQKLFVDFNSEVKKGQKLAEIDPSTYQQRLRQAEANFASTEAANRLQRLNTERTRELFAKKLVTQQDLDQAEAQLAQADAQLKTNQAAVENAKVDLERCTINSPIDGIVISKQTEEGKTVAASLNAPVLFTIANDLAKMQITAAVAEADIGAVENDQEVTFTADAFPNRTFHGTVVQVRNAPKTVSNVVTYDTIISVENRDLKLRPGMTANVSIVISKREHALRVPNAALRVRMPEGLAVQKTAPGAKPGAVAAATSTPAPAGADRAAAAGGQRGGRRGGLLGANATPEQREKMREIMTEVGIDFRSGPPTPEQRTQMHKLMVERGLIAPEAAAAGETPVVTRTVYRLPKGDKGAAPEAVTVKVGITDGLASEILDGIKEGDVLITSVTVPNARAGAPASNPFGGGRRF